MKKKKIWILKKHLSIRVKKDKVDYDKTWSATKKLDYTFGNYIIFGNPGKTKAVTDQFGKIIQITSNIENNDMADPEPDKHQDNNR